MNLYVALMTVASIDLLLFAFSKTVEGRVKWGIWTIIFLILALGNKPS